MRWDLGRTSGVQDRRGMGAGAIAGGGGIVTIVVALIGYFVFGIDPRTFLDTAQTTQSVSRTEAVQEAACPEGDEACRFADVIHTSTIDTWKPLFQARNQTYRPSQIALYTGGTPTGCGMGQSAMGPFYCPADDTIYIDLTFFHTLEKDLGAQGDFAMAYVIAHEAGHHVQNVLGVSEKVQAAQQRLSEREGNALSVRLELQADCYAGIWARQSNTKLNWLEAGDVEEGLQAAAAVGDDTLQKRGQGMVVPDSFTHGSSADRMKWFKTGYDSGNPAMCDTFGA